MYQSLTIVGNVGREPEMKFTAAGLAIVNFSVAVNNNRKVGENWEKVTTWFKVTAFGKLAERVNENVTKGSLVFCEGRLGIDWETGNPRIWQAKDGKYTATFEMTAENVFFGKKGSTEELPF